VLKIPVFLLKFAFFIENCIFSVLIIYIDFLFFYGIMFIGGV